MNYKHSKHLRILGKDSLADLIRTAKLTTVYMDIIDMHRLTGLG